MSSGGKLVAYLQSYAPPAAHKAFKTWYALYELGLAPTKCFEPDNKTLLKFYGWVTFTGAAFSRGWRRQLQVFGLAMQCMGLSRRGQDVMGAFGYGTSSRTHQRSELTNSFEQEALAKYPYTHGVTVSWAVGSFLLQYCKTHTIIETC